MKNTRPLYIHSLSAENLSYQDRKCFFCRNLKNVRISFCNVILRQPRVQASGSSLAQKWQGLRLVYSKNFSRATFFVFWVTQLVDRYLSYLPLKQIWRKSAVWEVTRWSLPSIDKYIDVKGELEVSFAKSTEYE